MYLIQSARSSDIDVQLWHQCLEAVQVASGCPVSHSSRLWQAGYPSCLHDLFVLVILVHTHSPYILNLADIAN